MAKHSGLPERYIGGHTGPLDSYYPAMYVMTLISELGLMFRLNKNSLV